MSDGYDVHAQFKPESLTNDTIPIHEHQGDMMNP